jgi:hypothetical protein
MAKIAATNPPSTGKLTSLLAAGRVGGSRRFAMALAFSAVISANRRFSKCRIQVRVTVGSYLSKATWAW